MAEKKHGRRMLFGGIGVMILVIAAVAGVKFFSASSNESGAIVTLLERRAAALNQKDLTQYLACFSVDYRSGDRTYEDLKADAELWFSQFETIQFTFQTVKTETQNNAARVENQYHFVLSGSGGKPVNITKTELLELRQEAAGWKITASLAVQ